jgi:hypothetical protein
MPNKNKPNRFKLTPQAYKNILAICARLAKFQQVDKTGKLRFEPVAKFIGTKDFQLSEIKGVGPSYTKQIEKGKKPLLINHQVNLIDIYQKDGDGGVKLYVDHFEKLANEAKEKKGIATT